MFLKFFWLPGWSFHTKLIIWPRRNICCSKALFFNVFVAGAICLYFVQNRGRMFHDTILKNLVSFSTDKYIYLFRNFNRCLNLFGDIKMQLYGVINITNRQFSIHCFFFFLYSECFPLFEKRVQKNYQIQRKKGFKQYFKPFTKNSLVLMISF